MVTQQGLLATFSHQVDTFARIRAVADNIAQAINFTDLTAVNVCQNRFQRFEITVNITYYRS